MRLFGATKITKNSKALCPLWLNIKRTRPCVLSHCFGYGVILKKIAVKGIVRAKGVGKIRGIGVTIRLARRFCD